MKRLLLIPCFLLAACQTTPERVRVETVSVAVPVKCVVKIEAPLYPDTDEKLRAAANIFDRTKLLLAGRLMRMAYEIKLTAALQKCAGE